MFDGNTRQVWVKSPAVLNNAAKVVAELEFPRRYVEEATCMTSHVTVARVTTGGTGGGNLFRDLDRKYAMDWKMVGTNKARWTGYGLREKQIVDFYGLLTGENNKVEWVAAKCRMYEYSPYGGSRMGTSMTEVKRWMPIQAVWKSEFYTMMLLKYFSSGGVPNNWFSNTYVQHYKRNVPNKANLKWSNNEEV